VIANTSTGWNIVEIEIKLHYNVAKSLQGAPFMTIYRKSQLHFLQQLSSDVWSQEGRLCGSYAACRKPTRKECKYFEFMIHSTRLELALFGQAQGKLLM
jgi:hypothetical protein